MARTRANDYDKKRQGILSRSATLFAEHGFTGTSITMIAEACGVSKALMYHYYSSKDAVLFDLLQDHLQNLVTVVEAAAQSAGKPEEKLFAISAALLERVKQQAKLKKIDYQKWIRMVLETSLTKSKEDL